MERAGRLLGYFDEHLETLAWEEKKKLLEKHLRHTVALAFERAPAMRQKLQAAGVEPSDIRSVEDLQGLGITPKSRMRELQQINPPFGGFLAVDPAELRRVYSSPGAIFDPEGNQPDYWRLQGVLFNVGFRPGDRVLNTFSYHLTPGGLMCDEALVGIGCTVIPGGVGNTENQIQLLAELDLTGYVGVPSFLQKLIERAEENGKSFRQDFSLELAVTAGEMLTDTSRKALEDCGLIVRQFLATADVGAIAYECAEKNGMHFTDHRIIEVVDPETGTQLGPHQVGEIVVTLLNNPVYPLIRFGTGDLSYYDETPCPCGRTSPRLMKLLGRADQVTKVRGMFIHPSQVEEVIAAFPEIQTAQAVVDREQNQDTLTFRAVLAESSSLQEGLSSSLKEKIRAVLKLRADVTFVREPELEEPHRRILDHRKWE